MQKPSTSLIDRLREHKLLWNLLLIVVIILAMAIAAHLLMQIGTRHGARRTVPDFSGIPLDEVSRIALAGPAEERPCAGEAALALGQAALADARGEVLEGAGGGPHLRAP